MNKKFTLNNWFTNNLSKRIQAILLFSFFIASAYSQTVQLVNGGQCVGSVMTFVLGGNCTSPSWSVTNGGTILSGQGTSSITARWSSPTSAIVNAYSSCNGGSNQNYYTNVTIASATPPSTANAGPDQTSSSTCGLTTVTLSGNTPSVGSGSWSVISGSGGSFSNSSSPTSTFAGTAGAAYTLRWSIGNGVCTFPSLDDVNISFNQNPTIANAGPDQGVCGVASTTLAATAVSVGSGSWSIISGAGGSVASPSASNSGFSGTSGTTYTLRWTTSNSLCSSSTDDVNITFTPRSNYTPQLNAPGLICSGTATITPVVTVSGTYGNLTYRWFINGAPQWASNSITVNATQGTTISCEVHSDGCVTTPVSTSTYTINLTTSIDPPVSIQFPKQHYCPGEVINLTASSPYGGTSFVWRVNGNLVTTTTNSSTIVPITTSESGGSLVYYNGGGAITVDVTGLSGSCLSTTSKSATTAGSGLDVYTLPTAAATPKTICTGSGAGVTITNPNNIPGTTYSWTPTTVTNVSGASASNGPSINQTLTNLNGTSDGTVIYTISPSANGCIGMSTTVTVIVKPNPTVSNAGPDKTGSSTCGLTTVTLSGNTPLVGSGSWSVISGSGGSFGNSSSPTSTFAGTAGATYTLRWTISNNPCTASSDNVIVTFAIKPTVAVSLSSQAICSGQPMAAVTITNPNGISGTTFSWNASSPNISGALSGSGSLILQTLSNITSINQTAVYTITPTAAGCSGNATTTAVTVKPIPVLTSTLNPSSIISGTIFNYSPSSAVAGASFTWSRAQIAGVEQAASSGTGSVSEQLLNSTTSPISVIYAYTITSAGCSVVQNVSVVLQGSQFPNENFIITNSLSIPNVTDPNSIDPLTINQRPQSISYFDGLGRTMQMVLTQGSPTSQDIVSPAVYDDFGREYRKYLPFSSGTDGWYKRASTFLDATGNYTGPARTFYSTTTDKVADDEKPFAESRYEPSPVNRTLKQGAPGADWQPNASSYAAATDRSTKFTYEANLNNEVLLWSYSLPTSSYPLGLVNAGAANTTRVYYVANQLSKMRTKNEEQNEVIEYSDKAGRVVLKRVQVLAGNPVVNDINYASTYYIYDDFGSLVCVIPPEAVKNITKTTSDYIGKSDAEKESFLSRWAFRYVYDDRSRMTTKQVPGALAVYMVYDNRDRLILTQDGVQRTGATNAIKYWTFTKYDELNRPILTGIKDTTTTVQLTQAQMQSAVDAHFAKSASRWSEVYVGNVANNMHGYTNNAYPVRGSTAIEIEANKYLTVTYYDNYTFRSLWPGLYTYLNEGLSEIANGITYTQPTTESLRVKGQVTGTKVKVLDGGITGAGAWIRSASYYDDKNRPLQSISDNITGGIDRSTTLLDFTGKVLKNKTSHSILWKDLVGVEAIPTGLIRTLAGTGWSAGAASVDVLPAGVNGWLEFVVAETNNQRMIGFSSENKDAGNSNMEFAVKLNSGNYNVMEGSTDLGTKTTVATGNIIRIERNGSTVTYLKNGTVVYTSLKSSNTPLMVDASLNDVAATLSNVNFSFKNATPRSITRRFEYDHAARLMKSWHKVDTQAEILLASNSYNELGQLVDKKLHSTLVAATNAKQSIDYRYNIRGWLTKINESDIEVGKNDASNAGEARDYFGMELGYNNDIGVANTSLFNGNISAMKWSKNQGLSTAKESAYNYSYDPMNRITAAAFKEKATSWNALANNGFSESNYTYDLNGNILTLTRYDQRGSTAPMDNLTMLYSYGSSASQSNKLLKVTDTGDVNAGFLDGATATTEYGYNDNGSMTFDSNKEIKSPISYNYLNLPELLTRGTSNTIRYVYDATGRKLSQVVSYNTSKKRTDYIGEYQYENSVLQSISHEEGRISLSNEVLAYQNAGDNIIGFTITTATASITPVTQNTNQTYLKVLSTGTTARTGITNVVTLGVVPGDRYKIRAKGYRDKGTSATSNPIYLLVQFNGVDKDFPGATLGSALTSEAWTEQIVTIPAAVNTLQAGIIWNTTVTAGELFYLNDFEVIKLNTNPTPEYQYNLTDHLGNVRVTFTTKDETEVTLGTFEEVNKPAEQGKFLRYDKSKRIQSTWFDKTNGAVTGYAERLNGSANEKYGIARSISVMPGDKINAEVYAKFVDTNSSNWTAALNTLLTQIAGGTASAGTVIDGAGYNTSTSSFSFGGLIDKSGAPVVGPKAYLNWLVFDKNYVQLSGGYKKMSDIAKEYGQDVAHELLFSPDINITQPGYVYIYLSNEEATAVEVYFDDFKVTHTKSPVIQSDDYYAFGERFNSYTRESSFFNKRLYNDGSELQDDLDINVYATNFRMYDQALGRWWQVDPKTDEMYEWSPYSFSYNNSIIHNDPEGDLPILLVTAGVGALIGGVAGGIIAAVDGQDLEGILTSAAGGAVSGAIVGSGAGLVTAAGAAVGTTVAGLAATGFVAGTAESVTEQVISVATGRQGTISTADVVKSAAVGGAANVIAGPLGKVISSKVTSIFAKATTQKVADATSKGTQKVLRREISKSFSALSNRQVNKEANKATAKAVAGAVSSGNTKKVAAHTASEVVVETATEKATETTKSKLRRD